MYKRILLLAVAVLTVVHQESYGTSPPQEHQELESEEYAVYSSLFDNSYARDGATLVIQKNYPAKNGDGHAGHLSMLLRDLSKEVREDFLAKNRQAYQLTDLFEIEAPYTLVSLEEYRGLSQKGFKKSQVSKRPLPSMTLSRVGFDAERTQAVVFVTVNCGLLCGEGAYFLLTKDDGAWKVQRKRAIWKS